MAHQVTIPAAGESINTASIGQWHKSDGDRVTKGELLATIETDKVSTELEAEVDGVIRILVPEGEEVSIGAVIAEIADHAGGVEPAASEPDKAADVEQAGPEQVAPAVAIADEEPPSVIPIKVPSAGESIASATVAQWHKRDGESVGEGEALVTLETDKVSAELDAEASGVLHILSPEGAEVSIGAVIGTLTVGGEPTSNESAGAAADLRAGMGTSTDGPAPPAAPPPGEAEAPPADQAAAAVPEVPARLVPDLTASVRPPERENSETVSDGRVTRKRMSPLRRKIAAQLVNAQQTAAILTTFNEVDMSAVIQLRKTVQESFIEKYGVKLGFMSLFVKAVVHALKEVPAVNARIDGNEMIQNHYYDIGIAVGTEKGLVVPVVREADEKSCAEIEKDILDYATRAREGKIQLEDLQGGVFTISNGGIYGSLLSTPILNPPQSGILGMHTIQERPVALDGQVAIRPMMYLALSYDHRLVDGREAVTFLIRAKESLENPASILLEL